MSTHCTFCRIAKELEGLGSSNLHFWWRFDIHPVSPGHTLVVPKRHIISLEEMTPEEWVALQASVRGAVAFIENLGAGMKAIYRALRQDRITENSVIFIDEVLAHPRIGEKPDGYNHGVNIGRAAGQTISHLHWHVIPRYKSDMNDPSGGVRYVIPRMGNYTLPR